MPAPEPSDRRRVALVTTTIHVPRCLDAYLENAARYGHAAQTCVVVIGDRKTPAETGPYLVDLARKFGNRIAYLDVPAQKALLRRWPTLDIVVRYDCIQRRNVGYLQAALDGAEVIVAM